MRAYPLWLKSHPKIPKVQFLSLDIVSQSPTEWVLSFRGVDQKGLLLAAAWNLKDLGAQVKSARVHHLGSAGRRSISHSASASGGSGVYRAIKGAASLKQMIRGLRLEFPCDGASCRSDPVSVDFAKHPIFSSGACEGRCHFHRKYLDLYQKENPTLVLIVP